MKKLITLLVVTLTLAVTPARADVYVIVDSNGVVVSGAIVCDAGTCGDPNSLYSRLTLKAGERYVLQGRTDSNGNNSGIGAQPNQILVVKEEPTKNTFVAITPTQTTVVAVTPTIVEPQPTPEPAPQPVVPTPTPTPTNTTETNTVITETNTVTTVADTATAGAVVNSDTTTTTTASVETEPETEIPLFSEALIEWLARWQELWAEFLLWLES